MITLLVAMMTGAVTALFLGAGRARRERLWVQERYLLEAKAERWEDRATRAEEQLAARGGPFR